MGPKDTFFKKRESINIQGKLYSLATPKVMGILNVTPDSFHDGDAGLTVDSAVKRAAKMMEDGADILDIGGQSTRPKATQIPAEEEWKRVETILKSIRKNFPEALISIDTFYAEVAERAVFEGADIVNDISAGSIDKKMFATVAKLQVPYILMHMQGRPQTMQENPQYKFVVAEVLRDFSKKINQLRTLGVNDLIIDPGFGFGKTAKHNFALLNQLADFNMLELPILVGLSRKRMINETLQITPDKALNGTTALNAFALERGANILRVHDVKEAKELITLHQTLYA